MIGLDANVLVRYITQDDATQSAQAGMVVDQLTESHPGYVTVVVLAELYWVLTRAYRADQESVVAVLQGLLESQEITVERADGSASVAPGQGWS